MLASCRIDSTSSFPLVIFGSARTTALPPAWVLSAPATFPVLRPLASLPSPRNHPRTRHPPLPTDALTAEHSRKQPHHQHPHHQPPPHSLSRLSSDSSRKQQQQPPSGTSTATRLSLIPSAASATHTPTRPHALTLPRQVARRINEGSNNNNTEPVPVWHVNLNRKLACPRPHRHIGHRLTIARNEAKHHIPPKSGCPSSSQREG